MSDNLLPFPISQPLRHSQNISIEIVRNMNQGAYHVTDLKGLQLLHRFGLKWLPVQPVQCSQR